MPLFTTLRSRASRTAFVVLAALLVLSDAGSAQSPTSVRAQAYSIDPLDMLLTADDAGADAVQVKESQGEDGPAHWARRRWERDGADGSSGTTQRNNRGSNKDAESTKDRDSHYAVSGPLVLDNTVYVANDLAAAKQVYQNEVSKLSTFPEATDRVSGSFPFPMTPLGDESAALSACNTSCNSDKEIYLHKRIVSRVENVVSVVYVWGLANEEGVTDASARYFANLVIQRIRG
jgi:hypothetical protein